MCVCVISLSAAAFSKTAKCFSRKTGEYVFLYFMHADCKLLWFYLGSYTVYTHCVCVCVVQLLASE